MKNRSLNALLVTTIAFVLCISGSSIAQGTFSEITDPVGDNPGYPSWSDAIYASIEHLGSDVLELTMKVNADFPPVDPDTSFSFCWGFDLDMAYSIPIGAGRAIECEIVVRLGYDKNINAYYGTIDYFDPSTSGEVIDYEFLPQGARVRVRIDNFSDFYWEGGITWSPGVADNIPDSGYGTIPTEQCTWGSIKSIYKCN